MFGEKTAILMLKTLARWLLRILYRTRITGLSHCQAAGPRVLVAANHSSYLDALLLWAFLPAPLTFAVNTHVARKWWVRLCMRFADTITLDQTKPLATKTLINILKQDRRIVIFPEGRRTTTGSLMKIYDGPGLIADKADATLLPVRIDGPQYTRFTRLRGKVRQHALPPVRLAVLPPTRLQLPADLKGRARRRLAGRQLTDIMVDMMFRTSDYRRTLLSALLEARHTHGGGHLILEDINRRPLSYDQLLRKAAVLGERLARESRPGETIGLMVPNSLATVVTLLGLHMTGRLPAMLNYSAGAGVMLNTCATAEVGTVITSRRFLEQAKRQETADRMAEQVRLLYLEDLAESIGLADKIRGLARLGRLLWFKRDDSADAERPAVILFTSGSEGTPKGVVLSHANLMANRQQFSAKIDFGPGDTILNAMPLFHSFGLTVGTLLPLLAGIKSFLYPSPLHYRIIPELAYDINATILFGTSTFLAGYAKFAHPYDFHSVRYVFAGAEKLSDETRKTWASRFGIRILEGYGATETSPGLSLNTPTNYREGSVGTLLPGVDYRLVPVKGITEGERLHVKGPNVMLGYLLSTAPGKLIPPQSIVGAGWYDTGDIVRLDEDGYLYIQGRAKRFAKVSGEMVSLAAVEALALRAWPGYGHAAVSLPDPQRGEQVILLSECPTAERARLIEQAKREDIGEVLVPRAVCKLAKLPLLPSGKIDYPTATELAGRQVERQSG